MKSGSVLKKGAMAVVAACIPLSTISSRSWLMRSKMKPHTTAPKRQPINDMVNVHDMVAVSLSNRRSMCTNVVPSNGTNKP